MKTNQGIIDRAIRIIIGIGMISIAFWGPETRWVYLGLIPLATGLLGVCPLYFLLGVQTCPLKDK